MESSNVICQEPSALVSDVHKDWVGIENAAEEFGTRFVLPSESINEKGPVMVRDSNSKGEANSPPHGTLKTSFKLSGLNISSTKDTLHRMWFGHNNQTEGKDCKNTECCEKKKPSASVNSKFSATKEALLQRIGFGHDFNEGKGYKTKDVENKEPPPTDNDAGIKKKTIDWSQTKETIQRLSLTLTKTAAARAEPVRKSWNQFVDDVKEHQKYRSSIDSQFTDRQRQESLTDVLLPPRRGHSIPFAVPPGSTIFWRFRVKAIGGAQEEELFPSFRFEAGVTYQGSWTAPEHENGTSKDVYRIVLLWDNSYSYVRSKTIAYSVEIRAEPLELLLSTSSSENETENIATSTAMPLVAHDKQNSSFYASPVSNEIII